MMFKNIPSFASKLILLVKYAWLVALCYDIALLCKGLTSMTIEVIKRQDMFKAASCSSSCFLVNILRPHTFFFLIFVQDLNKDNYQIKLNKILLMATETTICSYHQLGALCQSEIFRQFFVK